jgi:hypothetical protein
VWLKFLAGLGYQLSAIEQAVADGQPYTGDGTPDTAAGAPGEPDGSADPGDQDPGDVGTGDPRSEATGAGEADIPGQLGEDPAAA